MNYNFDRVSDQYDASRALPAGVTDTICQWVLSRLPSDPAVTEIGVGTGRIAIPFIERGVRFTGFDISEQMMELLRQKLGGELRRAELHLADITQPLPLPDGSQDAVLAVHILHLVDAERALPQIRRILKPHGALAWGYQLQGDESPSVQIRNQFRRIVEEIGGPPRRDFFMKVARQRLVEWGAEMTPQTVATWVGHESPGAVLETLRARLFSSTWHLDDATLERAADMAGAWAQAEYGDLDRSIAAEERFLIDWYQF